MAGSCSSVTPAPTHLGCVGQVLWPSLVALLGLVQCWALTVERPFQPVQFKVCNSKCVQYEEQDAALVPVCIQEHNHEIESVI